MTKSQLIKRLKWYYPTEKFHTYVTFPGLLIYLLYSNPIKDIVFLIYGLLACIVILYQGQLFWKLKLQSLMGENLNQEKNIEFFKKYKKLNFILIGFIPLFLLLQLYLKEWNFSSNQMLFWGLFANIFAILEHINYYHVQLMVDNKYDIEYLIKNKKLKKASLAKDLIEKNI